jgi:alkylation response protein AidB-like acyl-CoA dehydrogenase
MDFSPTESQAMIRDLARGFAREKIARVAAALDREERFPAELLREMAKLGLMGMNVPARFGGAEAGPVAYALAVSEIAYACASTAVTMMVTNMVAEAISRHGREDQIARYVTKIVSGEFAAASFALSEPESGSDAASLRATATPTKGGYLLDGVKQWITSGDRAGVILVTARLPETQGSRGVTAFLVPAGADGLSFGKPEEKMGLRASRTVQVVMSRLFVSEEDRLGEEGGGFRVMMGSLDGGRIAVGAQALGISRAALDAARAYAKERRQFGKPISDFQAIQNKLADMATQISAAELLVMRAASRKEAGKSVTREAAMAKLFSTEAAIFVTNEALQIFGGYGYTREYPVERHLRDARVTTIYEGTSEVQRLVISREVLRELA